jgi:hypothetical protein
LRDPETELEDREYENNERSQSGEKAPTTMAGDRLWTLGRKALLRKLR